MTPSKDIARLIEIMAALRTPVTGCPWDLEQTYETIAPYTIEEAYEVADAIARQDFVDLKDELGDLLLQVAYHARMAEEQDAFAFGDVVEAITAKMIRRHPHVFGSDEERAAGAAPGFWARIKAEERAEKAAARDAGVAQRAGLLPTGRRGDGLLADVSLALPALTRAVKLQDKAAKVGFDWPSLAPVFDKMREELAELEEIAAPADPRAASPDRTPQRTAKIEEEFGDLLFVMANVARHLKLDPEAALRGANQKFARRFAHIEHRLAEQGRGPTDSSLAEMDALWDEAKAIERTEKS
ncbi:nucleoside triphosphate pyrophosphohydrolase [uncultured Hyphomicrobium sp.]|uniref:nucleoside triphosphate pyrophosphohydrolase n=1 Tax=uncultured Hyphomicrobium sp. TaxID=194373 RepID=UPI0025FAC9B3|nr:nucleoside triphosphate pyrophosphohydrolase [uncultured Hyphomicrobium sp.]